MISSKDIECLEGLKLLKPTLDKTIPIAFRETTDLFCKLCAEARKETLSNPDIFKDAYSVMETPENEAKIGKNPSLFMKIWHSASAASISSIMLDKIDAFNLDNHEALTKWLKWDLFFDPDEVSERK